jgi:beta-phosphoglucomutase family hydrolase
MKDRLFDAVIFDLDGVITQTALVHSRAWKKMFDDYLHEREEKYGEAFREFSHQDDYLPYVDGKPRYKGVQSFLESRGIDIPFGEPGDSPETETICGIGNRKNIAFNEILKKDGVKEYPSTVELIHTLKKHGIHVGVASSSKNCKAVLEAAGLLDLMETRIDGVVSAELGLKGKPEPDIFTTAADRLGVSYDRAVVVEDAVSGVQAGKAGNFGLVLGIAREENSSELYAGGADIVVEDISGIGFEGIEEWFMEGLGKDNFDLVYHGYEAGKEKTRESLLTVGNGYMATRGSLEESRAGDHHYPATYMAGLYNRLTSQVAGRDIENEDFVNAMNWSFVTFRIDGGEWLDIDDVEILEMRRRLHLDVGIYCRKLNVRDKQGRETAIRSRRIVSMDDPHVAMVRYCIVPLNYSGKVEIMTELDGKLINDGVERYRSLNQKHIEPVEQGTEGKLQYLEVKTRRSGIHVAAAARVDAFKGKDHDIAFEQHTEKGKAITIVSCDVKQNESFDMVKSVAIYRSDDDVDDALKAAKSKALSLPDFQTLLDQSAEAWSKIWKKTDIELDGDRLAQKLLRLHIYHLMSSISPHNATIDSGIPARGLHGEAYRGHIFWDEIYILPFYYMHFPDAAKAVLMYRYNRLDEARKYADEYGEKGAMFPWQSGSDGREETQVIHLNPVSGKWGEDHSSLQRHVSLAIAYNTIQYEHYTGDKAFMEAYGAELLLEISRFWASKAEKEDDGRYSISGVMGPDEFHEKYPGSEKGGLKNNAYTNLMSSWVIGKTIEIINKLGDDKKKALFEKTGLTDKELSRWKEVSAKLKLDISHEGIIAQYEGYFDLLELDWDHYREKYDNIYRMDRLLKAEGKSPDDYKVAKQADMLMTYYNLDRDVVDDLIKGLGYELPDGYLKDNLNYYLQRTSHGSTLSRVVHAKLASMVGDEKLSWDLYLGALTSDYQDIQGGTTAEGIHAGVMAGTVLAAIHTYAGLDLLGDIVRINPRLPDHWKRISFNFDFKGVHYRCELTQERVMLLPDSDVIVEINGQRKDLLMGEVVELECPLD